MISPLARVDELVHRPLPTPPDALRRGPFRGEEPSGDRLHGPRTAALLGSAVGVTLLVCMLTGLISHLHQHPHGWFDMPSRPVWAYQVSQGLHVVCGIALVPLVLAKLWVVYPSFFTWPPARNLVHAADRALILPLVAGTLFQLVSGLLNIVQWYPWGFFFPKAHYAGAWIATGAVLAHVAFKAPLLVTHLGRRRDRSGDDETVGRDRRAVLIGVGVAVGAVTVATAGETFGPLNSVSLLGARKRDVGPQGIPVNRTAADARVLTSAVDPDWRLLIGGPKPVLLSLSQLMAMPQHQARLPIACVEGWSATGSWSGVRLQDVLDLADISRDSHVRVVSLEAGLYQSSPVGPRSFSDPLTLLALKLNGETLTLDHGYPVRLIGPNRPGVQQTKWLQRIEVI